MTTRAAVAGSRVIPAVRYRDAQGAIRWLCDVLGFEARAVYSNPDGSVAHAELTLGTGMIMLGSLVDNDFGRLIAQPGDLGGKETQCPYLVAPDVDEVYARVKQAGGEIVREIVDQDYGGRDFACRDPEGHVWSVGSYDPWAA